MSQSLYATPGAEGEAARPRRKFWKRILASKIILLSIAIHFMLGIGATYLIVERIQAKRKLTFQGGPGTPNASTQALEHKINMARRQETMSAPAQARRITTTGLAKISLPDMPSLPTADDITPDKMAGLGGVGVGFGMGGGGNGGGGGGRAVNLFGMHEAGTGIEGTFYDFRTQPDGRTPVGGMNIKVFTDFMQSFERNGWAVDIPHYSSPTKLYATHFLFPAIVSTESGAAFQSRTHPDGLWIAIYRGSFTAPEDGSFRFVGFGDNVMFVRLDGRLVLDASDHHYTRHGRESAGRDISFPRKSKTPLFFGDWFDVSQGQHVKIEVAVGDEGGIFCAGFFVQKQGTDYSQGRNNVPLLPLFALAPFTPAEKEALSPYLPEQCFEGPIWKGSVSSSVSDLDALIPGQ